MDIIEFNDTYITVFEGDITSIPEIGFIIYGPFGAHMLAYVNNGNIITLNAVPYKNIKSVMDTINVLLLEDDLWSR